MPTAINIEAEKRAREFRESIELSLGERIHLKSLLQRLSILTLFRPMSNNFSGLACKSNDSKFMLINSNMIIGRQYFTIAHELFHLYCEEKLVLHMCNPIYGRRTVSEKSADTFAAAFLMPESGISKHLLNEDGSKKKISLSTIIMLEQYYEVSRKAMLYRLKALGHITQTQVADFDCNPMSSAQIYGYILV